MKIFFNESGVTISSAHLTVHGQKYDIKNISSVGYKKLPPNYSLCVFCFLLGVLLAVDEGILFAFGGCLILGGLIAALTAQAKHVVVIAMPERRLDAVISANKAFVDRVIEALQASMGNRGSTHHIEAIDTTEDRDERNVLTSRMIEYYSRPPAVIDNRY